MTTSDKRSNLFVTLSTVEYEAIKRPAREQMQLALEKGRRERDAAVAAVRSAELDTRILFR